MSLVTFQIWNRKKNVSSCQKRALIELAFINRRFVWPSVFRTTESESEYKLDHMLLMSCSFLLSIAQGKSSPKAECQPNFQHFLTTLFLIVRAFFGQVVWEKYVEVHVLLVFQQRKGNQLVLFASLSRELASEHQHITTFINFFHCHWRVLGRIKFFSTFSFFRNRFPVSNKRKHLCAPYSLVFDGQHPLRLCCLFIFSQNCALLPLKLSGC